MPGLVALIRLHIVETGWADHGASYPRKFFFFFLPSLLLSHDTACERYSVGGLIARGVM
jgi:hypothetical protein